MTRDEIESDIANRLYNAVMKDPLLAKAIADAGLSISLVNAQGVAVGSRTSNRDVSNSRSPRGADILGVLASDDFAKGARFFVGLIDNLASRPNPSRKPSRNGGDGTG